MLAQLTRLISTHQYSSPGCDAAHQAMTVAAGYCIPASTCLAMMSNMPMLLQGVTMWSAQPCSAQQMHVNRASSTAILWHLLW
jgi:hypothetical protein